MKAHLAPAPFDQLAVLEQLPGQLDDPGEPLGAGTRGSVGTLTTDGILMELFLDVFVNMVRKLWFEMGKVLLGVVVTLKVHEEYGRREVRPAL